jgi:hypothetical protein
MPRAFSMAVGSYRSAFDHGRDLVEAAHIFQRIAVDQDQVGGFSAVNRSLANAEPDFDCLNSSASG